MFEKCSLVIFEREEYIYIENPKFEIKTQISALIYIIKQLFMGSKGLHLPTSSLMIWVLFKIFR